MTTFAELYCAKNGCAPRQFRRRVFWRTLHWHAWPLAPLLLLGGYFTADDELISVCGRTTRMAAVREELRAHPFDPQNQGWLRRRMKVRVSLGRLRKLAAGYLATHRAAPGHAEAADPVVAADRVGPSFT